MPRRDDVECRREHGGNAGADRVELHIFIPLDLYAYIAGIEEGAPKKSPVTHSLCDRAIELLRIGVEEERRRYS